MTTIAVPSGSVASLIAACSAAGLPVPQSVQPTNGGVADPVSATLTYEPDLTAEQQATFDAIRRLAVGATLITPAERTALESDLAGLRTYQGIASPTLAQTVSAVRAQSRVLRALLRD